MPMPPRKASWTMSDALIEDKIKLVKQHLAEAKRIYSELLCEGVYAHFYHGSTSMMETYIPEKSTWKRNRTETFGE